MNTKPIGPTAHGAIDCGFATANALAPSILGFKGAVRTLCYAFAATQGVLDALTDHPLGIKRIVPLHIHSQLETPYVPMLLLLPWVTGALKQQNARRYFVAFFLIALANYLLSDYNAYKRIMMVVSQAQNKKPVNSDVNRLFILSNQCNSFQRRKYSARRRKRLTSVIRDSGSGNLIQEGVTKIS